MEMYIVRIWHNEDYKIDGAFYSYYKAEKRAAELTKTCLYDYVDVKPIEVC